MKNFLTLLFALLAVISAGYGYTPGVIDGYGELYVFPCSNGAVRVVAARADGSVLDSLVAKPGNDLTFRYRSMGAGTDLSFEFTLHEKIEHPWRIDQPEKVLVVSDFHGELGALAAVLKGNGVVDDDLDWVWGENQLIVAGDMLDRGRDDNGIAWLVYKLEKQAEDVGGRVDFIAGNHEDLVMKNDLRYIHQAHAAFATEAGIPYSRLYGADTELGRWLRDKHLILTMGRWLFVHAGLSTQMCEGEYTIDEINERARKYTGIPNKERNAADARNEPLFGSNGVIWYRGLVSDSAPISSEDLDRVLEYYSAQTIVIGHSEVAEVECRYEGRVVAINVKHAKNFPENRTAGILMENDKIYPVTYSGYKKPLGQ